ncbi:hypothetical protein [Nocardia aurea]|uniref:hypothetical protein n=1 Tax=Nocardia aurea TaxID=2144174 RepID=UPI0018E5A215|nr:hypothetical protein [Nocardia aurea]
MTLTPATTPNGHSSEPESRRTVTLRKPTDPPRFPAKPYELPAMPKRDIRMSVATGKPIPREWLAQLLALHSEQERIGVPRDPATFSQMEGLVMSEAMLAAEEARDHGADRLGELVDHAAVLKGEMSTTRAELDRLEQQPIVGMNGDTILASRATERMATVSAKITEERDAGNLKHRRVPLWLHNFSTWAALLDFPVLLHFVTQVFNVDLASLSSGNGAAWGESLIPLITATVFALLGTAAVAIGLKFFGRDLKGYKDDHGGVAAPGGWARTIPLLFVSLASLLAIGAGIVMAYRVVSDSLAAGNGVTSAMILGVFFAVVVVTVNVVVFMTYFRDGSLQTDEIGHLATQLEPIQKIRVQLQERIDNLAVQLPPIELKAERVYAATLAKIGTPLKGADQLRLLARSYHQGCGAEATFTFSQGGSGSNLLAPQVTVNYAVLDQLMERLAELVTVDNAPADEAAKPSDEPASTALVPSGSADADSSADDLGGEW